MELGHRGIGLGLGTHFDERETARTSGGAVLHDVNCDDSASGGKMILQIIFSGTEREVTDE